MGMNRAIVIGAGMIGSRLDQVGSAPAQTHCGAYYNSRKFELCALCDVQPNGDSRKWGIPVFENLDSLHQEVSFDVATVSVTPDQQPDILRRLLQMGVKGVIAEKPLAPTFEQAEELVSLYADNGVPLVVNFSRRFLPFYQKLKNDLAQQSVLSATIRYAKGLAHNGSHGLDLIRYLFGDIENIQPLLKRIDYRKEDPSWSVFLSAPQCSQVFFEALDEKAFTLFEVEVFTTEKRYLITNDHRECHVWSVQENVGRPLGKRLVKQDILPTYHEMALDMLVEHFAQVLEKHTLPCSSGENAVAVQRVVSFIKG